MHRNGKSFLWANISCTFITADARPTSNMYLYINKILLQSLSVILLHACGSAISLFLLATRSSSHFAIRPSPSRLAPVYLSSVPAHLFSAVFVENNPISNTYIFSLAIHANQRRYFPLTVGTITISETISSYQTFTFLHNTRQATTI